MQEVKNRLGVIFFPAFDWAISPTHPERQERLLYTMDQLKEEGVFDIPGIREYKPDVAELEDVERVHFCFPDVQSNVTDSHLISAGGTIKAARLLMEGREDKIFALVRPPGHHSMKVVHGGRGFCNINIEAIMVEYLRDKYGIDPIFFSRRDKNANPYIEEENIIEKLVDLNIGNSLQRDANSLIEISRINRGLER